MLPFRRALSVMLRSTRGRARYCRFAWIDRRQRHAATLGDALGGRPSVLIFADYTCRTLCGPILEFAVNGLEHSGLKPGTDYRLVVIGLDPKDGLAEARSMRSAHLDGSALSDATTMLIGRRCGGSHHYPSRRLSLCVRRGARSVRPSGRRLRDFTAGTNRARALRYRP